MHTLIGPRCRHRLPRATLPHYFKDQLTAVGFLDESQALGVLCNTFRHHSLLFRQMIILRPPKEPLLSLRIFKDNAILPYFLQVFHPSSEANPHTLLRQELIFLRKLHHLSIITMVGVCMKPWSLIMEIAPMGCLGSLLSNGQALSRGIQHRIALQVGGSPCYTFFLSFCL